MQCLGEAMEEMTRQGDREARFMGSITAGMTHEIRNVLAVIRESAGLMEDIMSLPESNFFPHKERFSKALGVIQQQVERAVELVGRLNRFAHSMDQCWATVELGDVLEQASALLARQARNRKVELRVRVQVEGVRIETDPFALGMLVCRCIEHCVEGLGPGTALELEASKEAGRVILRIRPASFGEEGQKKEGLPPELGVFADVLAQLGFEAKHEDGHGGRSLLLLLEEV